MSNNIDKKLLFFDIDGTLVGFDGKMRESTMKALKMARQNGHEIFIASGRSYGQIYPFLLDFGFDGIICAAGAFVEYNGKEIFRDTFGNRRMKFLMNFFMDNQTNFYIQTKDFSVLPKSQLYSFVKTMRPGLESDNEKEMEENLKKILGDLVLDDDIKNYYKKYDVAETIVYYDCPYSINEMRRMMGPMGMKVTRSSFTKPSDYMGELTLLGLNKSNGIKTICDYLHMDIKDTICFGDGPNDIDMLDAAGYSVCMGNGDSAAKERADLIADDIENDGIYKAMDKLGLI